MSGLCTSDTVDLDEQIIDLDFSRKGLSTWGASWGNVRQMHSTNLPPAGKAIDVDTTRPEGVYLTARIVEPTAVKLVKEGVYSAFSVGISKPRIIRDKVAKNGRVVDGVFSEVSVVDFPALPSAKFEIMKRAHEEIETLEKSLTPVGTLYKRNVDPDVGGGVDRDKVSAEDFAGKDRSFPIVTPSDVSDTASSIGRSGSDNYSSDQLKKNIIEIAQRKGPNFVAELPESWKDAEKGVETEVEKSATECEVCKGAGCEKCMDAQVKKAASDCTTCKGTGKIMEGNRDCPDCDGNAVSSEVEKKGKVPKDDADVTDALEDADDAVDAAQEAQAKDNAKHVAGMPEEEDDEDEKKDAKKILGVDLSYALRRIHDATCPAYSRTVVEAAHPAVAKNGLKSVIDPEIVRTALADAAMSTSFDPEVVRNLAEALESALSLADAPYAEVEMARDTLAKGFADAYPTANVTPGNVTPGQFQRTFLSAGRAPLSSTGADPRIPYVGESTADADDFDRSALTDGHERTSPSSTDSALASPSGHLSAVDQLAAISRDNAMVSIAALHERIAAVHPALCALDGSEAGIRSAGFSHAGMESMDMSGSITDLKAAAATPAIEKSADDSDTIVAEVDGGQEVLIDTEVLTSLVKTILAEQMSVKFDEMQEVLDAVQADVQKMASEPDPAQAPLRGTVAVERAIVTKSVTEADMLRSKAEEDFKSQVQYLETLTKSGNPELRMRAQGQLERLFDRAVMSTDLS